MREPEDFEVFEVEEIEEIDEGRAPEPSIEPVESEASGDEAAEPDAEPEP